MEAELGSPMSQSVANSLWTDLWTCRKKEAEIL